MKEIAFMPLSRDAMLGANALEDLADTYLICSMQDLAISTLEKLLSVPSQVNANELKLNPWYDSLRDNPRFQKLIEDYN